MQLKTFIPGVIITTSSILGACENNVNKIGNTLDRDLELNQHFIELVADTFSQKFSDEDKIIEFNKLLKEYNHSQGNYIIIDKKACKATVYSPDGDILNISEVAVGKDIGDLRGGGYKEPKIKLRAYTTPGEYTIRREGCRKGTLDEKLYGKRVLILDGDHTIANSKGKQVLALHQVPSTPMGKLRENVFGNKTLKDNRVSYGCVNFLSSSFDKMRQFIKGIGTKVYILPEEEGNSLFLDHHKNSSYKFVQTKYKTESLEPKQIKNDKKVNNDNSYLDIIETDIIDLPNTSVPLDTPLINNTIENISLKFDSINS